jgi:integrase
MPDGAAAISENGIGADGGASTGEAPMCRAFVFKDRGNTWRVRLVDTETKRRKSYVFGSEDEARAAVPKLIRAYLRPVGVPISKALDEYETHLATRGNRPGRPNRPRTIEVTIDRLTKLFTPAGDCLTGELTCTVVAACWKERATGKAVDTNSNTLAQAKTFVKWLAKKNWLKATNLLDGIEVLGERRRGKPQLTEDESKKFLTHALASAEEGDTSAVAAACALLVGLRASEIAERIVRDLDAGGTKLHVTRAKSSAGIRTMKVPAVLQPLLKRLAEGKQPSDRLFGGADRFWIRRHVRRLCKAAGVPVVPPHGLRGTHGRLAVEAGVSGDVVAKSLGHESFTVTERHYAGSDAVAAARVDRVAEALH